MKEKEELFLQYLEITEQALEELDPEKLEGLMEAREELIAKINAWDEQRGKVMVNSTMLVTMEKIQALDVTLKAQIESYRADALQKLQAIKTGQMAKDHYYRSYSHTDGVFYDKRK